MRNGCGGRDDRAVMDSMREVGALGDLPLTCQVSFF